MGRLSLKATVTKRPAAEPVPPDMAERLRQMQHHEAQTAGASTGTEPVQSPGPDKARQTAVEAATGAPEEQSGKSITRESHALQATFLSANLGKPVTVATLNNIRLTGRLKQYDQYCLLLEGPDGLDSMVFKSAVTTIAPTR